ncbi:Inositol 2-dehydrogenase [Anatilimnocola aggregata]|uniref:Inositol 2-dehydrogenase n=1 Tax=Anatilimnocola aggregata TaxID=2528021 RepID=A0A517YEL7_9BACT|nr:Gfo/Idh/MocA family oxidoreductase [Anatilimnocola aggregata]QDU28696.1 Inositol 2-dehydrogenase [Anatilimnocola aggregata]
MSNASLPAETSPEKSRRSFLKSSAALAVAGSVVTTMTGARAVHAAGSDMLKVALIGCGGRGSGAAVDSMAADKNAKITVLADAFGDRVEIARNALKGPLGEQLDVKPENCFVGIDAYKQVMASDVDVVLLCSPPGFRPAHLRAAVEAGKHVFCEKPVAVDAPGVRSVLESSEIARQKNLNLVSGLCWRYDYGVRETMKQIQDGMIGDIVAIQENYLTGGLWHRGREEKWSEMEYQMRNWLYFTWLSGDHNVEQHIHSLDKAMWLMGDKPPKLCYGIGGRQVRTGEKWGNIYDHHAVCYEWDNGVKCFAFTRQMPGCFNETEDYVLGTKGKASLIKHEVTAGDTKWKYRGPKPSMYKVEHVELFGAIRAGSPINNGTYMSYSTLLAIMGRMATYTGQNITWDMAMSSVEDLTPRKLVLGDTPVPKVAIPGETKFS